jgi:nucleoid DNA-binding protein
MRAILQGVKIGVQIITTIPVISSIDLSRIQTFDKIIIASINLNINLILRNNPVMTLTKNDIIEEIRTKNGFSRNKSIETVETLLEIIKQTLASGEDVMISGFGKFCVKEKTERKGRKSMQAAAL